MTGLLTLSGLAFLLGMRHATDADHVIAVTTIVTRHRTLGAALGIGAAWGLGHTLTILLVGGAIVLTEVVIPVRLELSMELAVGVMLIALGLANLDGLLARITGRGKAGPVEPHSHGDYVHTHAQPPGGHPHEEHETPVARLDRRFGGSGAYRLARPLLVGVVHGLAGSAAVALIVLATIPGPGWSVAYLVVFGLGTILGMMLVTTAIALPLLHPRAGSQQVTRTLRTAAGVLSLGFGLFLVYHIGLTEGLLRMP